MSQIPTEYASHGSYFHGSPLPQSEPAAHRMKASRDLHGSMANKNYLYWRSQVPTPTASDNSSAQNNTELRSNQESDRDTDNIWSGPQISDESKLLKIVAMQRSRNGVPDYVRSGEQAPDVIVIINLRHDRRARISIDEVDTRSIVYSRSCISWLARKPWLPPRLCRRCGASAFLW